MQKTTKESKIPIPTRSADIESKIQHRKIIEKLDYKPWIGSPLKK